jgi:hypothetical protein
MEKYLIKTIINESKKNPRELSKLIDKYLIPEQLEKKKNAEVSTPYQLRQDMLNKIPIEFWSNPDVKVFEPCSGKGGFLIDILERFNEGLKSIIEDDEDRYQHIVENIIYFADINPTNIYIGKLLLNRGNDYNLNYFEGNTLECDIQEEFCIDGFDAVIGNPPYNASGNTGTGHTIWQHFTYNALRKWLKENGYLCYVHPSGWRRVDNYKYTENKINILLSHIMKNEYNMNYLEIHNTNDGQKIFKCGTRYDWYIIQKSFNKNHKTIIKDENGKIIELNIKNYMFIPNYDIDFYDKIKGNYERAFKRNFDYSSTKKNLVVKEKNNIFKYELIHSTTKKGIRYLYTNDNSKGYFGKPKLIFGDSGINDVIIDNDGIYSVSEHGICLNYENMKEAKIIKNVLLSNKYQTFLKSCSWSNYQIDWKLFNCLKKDFWKEFLDE